MRWGVRDEATDDHMTTELCMKEIENCQRLSMGPNFVVSLSLRALLTDSPTQSALHVSANIWSCYVSFGGLHEQY